MKVTPNKIKKVLDHISKNKHGIVIHEYFIQSFGDLQTSVVLSYLLKCDYKNSISKPDGKYWFTAKYKNINIETDINIKRISKIIHLLRACWIISTKRIGAPAMQYFSIDHEYLIEFICETLIEP